MKHKPSIFVSYAHTDAPRAMELITELKKSFLVHNDQEIKPGEPWDKSLREKINGSDYVISLLSPNTLARSNVNFELGAALALDKHVVPVILGGNPEDYKESFGSEQMIHTQGRTPEKTVQSLIKALKLNSSSTMAKSKRNSPRKRSSPTNRHVPAGL